MSLQSFTSFIVLAAVAVWNIQNATACNEILKTHGVFYHAFFILIQSGQLKVKDFSDDFEGVLLFEKFWAEEKDKIFHSFRKSDFELFSNNLAPNSISNTQEKCFADIGTLILAARNRLRWAIEKEKGAVVFAFIWAGQRARNIPVIDASGKPGSGLLRKNLGFLGDYDQCMDVATGQTFKSRYCTTFLVITKVHNTTFSTTVPFYSGLCLPGSCEGIDVERLLNEYFEYHPDISARAMETDCRPRNPPLPTSAKVAICIYSILGLILVVATVYEVLHKMWMENSRGQELGSNNSTNGDTTSSNKQDFSEHRPIIDSSNVRMYSDRDAKKQSSKWETFGNLLMTFSLHENIIKLFSTKQSQDSIGCIHGLKFFTINWIILYHFFVMGLPAMENRDPYLADVYDNVAYTFLSNSIQGVNTFFALSGLLLTYQVFRQLSNEQVWLQFFGNFYFHRFWRLTPPYMLILMAHATVFNFFADGPLWIGIDCQRKNCQNYWWANLLYINNFFVSLKQCMPWSWYLSCDFQFYAVSPLLFLPLFFYGWYGLFAPLAFLLGSVISSGVISSANAFATIKDLGLYITPELDDYHEHYYVKPYTRIGPFIIGTITGYILFRFQCEARLPKWLVVLGWITSLVTLAAVLFGVHDDLTDDRINTDVAALYNSLANTAWGIAICWIIFACANGYGGIIDSFLSWKGFVPFSRLSLCAYLLHIDVVFYVLNSQRTYMYMQTLQLVIIYLGVVVLTYIASTIAFLAFEAPMAGLEKVIKTERRKMSTP